MRRRLADYRLAPAGGALMFVLGAAVIVLLVGPHHDHRPALILLVIALAVFLLGVGANRRPRAPERRRPAGEPTELAPPLQPEGHEGAAEQRLGSKD